MKKTGKKYKSILFAVFIILFGGISLTVLVNAYIGRKRMLMANQTLQTDFNPSSGSLLDAPSQSYSSGTYEDYKNRFMQEDLMLARLKEENSGAGSVVLKNIASMEFRYWDSQLATLYNAVISNLSEEEAAALAKDEQDWLRARDAQAVTDASKYAQGTKEGLEYTSRQAMLTRQRVYDLLEQYRDKLIN